MKMSLSNDITHLVQTYFKMKNREKEIELEGFD